MGTAPCRFFIVAIWMVLLGLPGRGWTQEPGSPASPSSHDLPSVIGRALVTLDGEPDHIRSRETNFGNLLADLLRAHFKTDMAVVNGGQVRGSIRPGPVDLAMVKHALPFTSSTTSLVLTGRQVLEMLENSAARLPQPAGRFLQVSGLSVEYRASAPPHERVRTIAVGGQPLDPDRRYRIATDAYLADGRDGYAVLTEGADRADQAISLRDLLIEALRKDPIRASVDGRIRVSGIDEDERSPLDASPHMEHKQDSPR